MLLLKHREIEGNEEAKGAQLWIYSVVETYIYLPLGFFSLLLRSGPSTGPTNHGRMYATVEWNNIGYKHSSDTGQSTADVDNSNRQNEESLVYLIFVNL